LADSLFTKLKNRNVFKVGVAYLLLAWVMVQVTAIAVPAFNMPEWMNTIVFFLGLIGFPFALFFAWAFEMAHSGIKEGSEISLDSSITAIAGRKLVLITIAIMVIALGYFIYESRFESEPKKAIATKDKSIEARADKEHDSSSIAVLPFVNMSSDKEQEYFSDGISEEILNVLAKIPKLHVTSRSSSFFYKGKDINISNVAEELGVSNVLEGSVRKSGNRVRITAQLIEAGTDKHLWSQTYDRALTTNNIFKIQDEISVAIVDALKLTLNTGSKKTEGITTTNMEAYNALLQGRFEYQKRHIGNYGSLLSAIEFYRIAVMLDPSYADAYAELGRALAVSNSFGLAHNFERQVKLARLATNKALSLAPDNYQALLSSAIIKFLYEGDFASAEDDFLRAIEIAPNNPDAYNFYGDYLTTIYRLIDAAAIEGRSALLDPKSTNNAAEHALSLIAVGRVKEGYAILESLLAMNPDLPRLQWQLANSYEKLGKMADARALYKKMEKGSYASLSLAFFAEQGDAASLTKLLTKSERTSNDSLISLMISEVYFKLGQYDESAIWFNKSLKTGMSYYVLERLVIVDPSRHIEHVGLNEILNRPDIAKWMTIRRKNFAFFNQSKR